MPISPIESKRFLAFVFTVVALVTTYYLLPKEAAEAVAKYIAAGGGAYIAGETFRPSGVSK